MAHFEEQADQPYDWNHGGVYVIEREDPVDGGLEGVSNRQAAELTQRTRNLHGRLATAEGEIDGLQSDLPIAAEAAKRSAMEHTDQTAAAIRDEQAIADATGLRSAKDYADRIVAALVDGSPEMLNTLEELAAALGGDPEFATTVMTEIGKRATKDELTAKTNELAVAPKSWIVGADCNNFIAAGFYTLDGVGIRNAPVPSSNFRLIVSGTHTRCSQIALQWDSDRVFFRRQVDGGTWHAWIELYHSGNTQPVSKAEKDDWSAKAPANHTHQLSSLDNATFDRLSELNGYMLAPAGTVFRKKLYWAAQQGVGFGGGLSLGYKVGKNRFGNALLGVGTSDDGTRYLDFEFTAEGNIICGDNTFHHTGNLKIIRGSVRADGGPAGGGFYSYKSGEVIYVDHNFGHTQFMAVATVYGTNPSHRDNVATVIYKDNTKVGFQVTAGPDATVEWAPFDFIIMPY